MNAHTMHEVYVDKSNMMPILKSLYKPSPTAPRINANEGFDDRGISLSALCLSIAPCAYKSVIIFDPIGNPPMFPQMNAPMALFGMPSALEKIPPKKGMFSGCP